MENIKIIRKQEVETENIMVGDQIRLFLLGFGDFTATAHKITDKGVLFIFDKCVIDKPMNNKFTNEREFENSDLKKWIDSVLLKVFPLDLKCRITDLSIPTVGEFFGHDDEFIINNSEPDDDEQLPLMKERKYRISNHTWPYKWAWLRNATRKEISTAGFVCANGGGGAAFDVASSSNGVRPEFWLMK